MKTSTYKKPSWATRNHFWLQWTVVDKVTGSVYECGTVGDIANIVKADRTLVNARLKSKSKRKPRSKIVDWSRYLIIKMKHKKLNANYFRTIKPSNLRVQYMRTYDFVLKEFQKKYC